MVNRPCSWVPVISVVPIVALKSQTDARKQNIRLSSQDCRGVVEAGRGGRERPRARHDI